MLYTLHRITMLLSHLKLGILRHINITFANGPNFQFKINRTFLHQLHHIHGRALYYQIIMSMKCYNEAYATLEHQCNTESTIALGRAHISAQAADSAKLLMLNKRLVKNTVRWGRDIPAIAGYDSITRCIMLIHPPNPYRNTSLLEHSDSGKNNSIRFTLTNRFFDSIRFDSTI